MSKEETSKKIAKSLRAQIIGKLPETGGGAFGAGRLAEVIAHKKYFSNFCAVVMLSALIGGCQPMGGHMPDDATTMAGTWKPVSAEMGGQAMPDAFLNSITLKLGGGKYEASVAGATDRGTATLDATANPRRITIVGTDGPNAGKTFLAIYEITGDTLRVCYDLSGKSYPAEFKTTAGTQLYLVSYRRAAV